MNKYKNNRWDKIATQKDAQTVGYRKDKLPRNVLLLDWVTQG